MNGLIAFWAKNHVAANLLMIMIIVAGLFGYGKIEKEVFPNFSMKGAEIRVSWPGASPQEVEEQIIVKIEEIISDVDNIDEITAQANENFAYVRVKAKDNVDNVVFVNEIKSRVDGIFSLPQSSFPPIVSEIRYNEPAQYLALISNDNEVEMNKIARSLRDELATLPKGSPLVQLWGARNREVSIEISEKNLRSYGITFDEISQAIRGTSVNLSAGVVRTKSGDISLRARNLADSEQAFENIVIKQNSDGGVIKLGAIAKVVDGFEDRRVKRELNGKNAILIVVLSPDKVNIPELSQAVQGWIKDVNTRLPDSYEVINWFDTIEMYNGRMKLVTGNAITGLILVLITLLLFLHPKVAFWVSAGIGVSFIGSFFFLPMVGVSLNMLSLFAFLLVIGVVVDDAIIVGENITAENENGKKGVDAAIIGTQLVAKPVLYAVLTTMIAFSPWLFISGSTSNYTKHISLTIIFALTFSLIESFFILPSHLTKLTPLPKSSSNIFINWFLVIKTFAGDGLTFVAVRLYRPTIEFALKWRYLTILFFWSLFMLSVGLLSTGWIKFHFMPQIERTYFEIKITMPEGTSYERSLQVFEQTKKGAYQSKAELKNKDDKSIIDVVYVKIDENNIEVSFSIIGSEERKITTKEVAQYVRKNIGGIPDAREIESLVNFNNSSSLTLGISSKSGEDLQLASKEIKQYLSHIAGVYDIRDKQETATKEIRFKLRPGAERYNLTLYEIIRQVRQAYYGEEVQRLPREGEDVRVMLRYPIAARSSLDSMKNFRVRTRDGKEIPLSAVATISFAPSLKSINRVDRKKTTTIYAEIKDSADRGVILKSYNKNFLPELKRRHVNVTFKQRGEQEAQQDFVKEFMGLYGMALLIMYALLAIAFSSYIQPILIMSAIPFAFMGAMFGHLFLHVDMAMFSFFGIGAAAGVVVNDNLVLIDYLNRLRKGGVGAIEAIIRSGQERFRPILLTSITTFIGLVPIMMEQSFDAQFLMPTIVSLAFGVFFATFVTLIFVPCMYAVGVDGIRWLRGLWTGIKQPKLGHGDSLGHDY